MEFIINHWHWLILALILLGIEVFTMTAFFLWLSAACAATATVVYFMPDMIWEYQFALAGLFIGIGIALWRKWGTWFSRHQPEHKLNRRNEQYIGRVFVLTEAIENGTGKIRVDDSTWRVQGEDAPVNSRVKVIGARGMILEVEIVQRAQHYTDQC